MRRLVLPLILLIAAMTLTLNSCILFNPAPIWKDLPLQIVPLGQTLNIDVSQYVSDKNDQYISFTIISGIGEIIDTSYVYTPSPTELNDSSTKEIEVILRATDSKVHLLTKYSRSSSYARHLSQKFQTVTAPLVKNSQSISPRISNLTLMKCSACFQDRDYSMTTHTHSHLQLPVHTQSHSVYTTALYSPHCNNSTSTYSNIHSKST